MEMHSFTYVKRLILKNANYEAFTDFPVLVIIDDSAGYYPSLEASNQIAFYASDNTTELKWGCKEFNDGGKSYYWVKVPTVLATDTDYIYMYWGGNTSLESKSGVCDASTVLMTPMVDYGDTSHIEDWTGVNTLTKKGAGEPVEAAGSIGLCQDFDGSNDYISTPNPGGTYSAMTYEIYAQLPGFTGTSRDIMRWDYGTTAGPLARLYSLGDTALLYLKTSEGTVSDSFTFTADSWYYFGQKWTGSKLYRIFNNTIDSESSLAGSVAPNDAIYVGAYNATTNRYNGLIGLIRISNTARSDNWLKAQDKILRTQDYVTFGGIVCTFSLADNQLTTVTGADAGTYPINDNKTDIVIGGVTHSIYPFSQDHFISSTNNLLTIEV